MTDLTDSRAAMKLPPLAADSKGPAIQQRWFCSVPMTLDGRLRPVEVLSAHAGYSLPLRQSIDSAYSFMFAVYPATAWTPFKSEGLAPTI
jgi:hypothetical protein